jgi:hypothetical protein
MLGEKLIGKKVLVRAGSAGVHYGTLIERSGQEVHLQKARRIWSWNGALSLSEIAKDGVDLKTSKISVPVDDIILTTTIEILGIKEKCNLP